MTKIVPTEKARQGNWGKHTLMILISALILVAIVWAGVEFYGESIDAGSSEQVPAATTAN